MSKAEKFVGVTHDTRAAQTEPPSVAGRVPGKPGAVRSPRITQWLNSSGPIQFRRETGKTTSWHVLKQHRFLAYFVGNLISNLGTWLQNTAQLLLALFSQ
jgi:hypothetical protein